MLYIILQASCFYLVMVNANVKEDKNKSESKKSMLTNIFLCDRFPSLCSELPYSFNPDDLHKKEVVKKNANPSKKPTMCDYYPSLCQYNKIESGFYPSLYGRRELINEITKDGVSSNSNQKDIIKRNNCRSCRDRKCMISCLSRIYR